MVALTLATSCKDSEPVNGSPIGGHFNDPSYYLSEEALRIGCSIASEYVSKKFEKAEKPLFLSDDGPSNVFLSNELAAAFIASTLEGKDADPMSEAMKARADAFATLAERSPTQECSSLESIKATRSHTPNPEDEYPPVTPDLLFFEYDIIVVQLPLVDLNSGKAFMGTHIGCGPLCGSSQVITFTRRIDGRWVETDVKTTAIS